MPEEKSQIPGQNKIGTYQHVRAVSCWWNQTSFTSYIVKVSASLNMLTDRTRQVPDVAETVMADTFFSSGVTFTFKQALLSTFSCTGCIAENDFKSTCCALTNTDSVCKACMDSQYMPHLFLFQISK